MKVVTDFKSIGVFAGICSAISAVAGIIVGVLVGRKIESERRND